MRPGPTLQYIGDVGLARGQRKTPTIIVSSVMGGMLLSFGGRCAATPLGVFFSRPLLELALTAALAGAMFVLVGGGTPELALAAPGLGKLVSAMVFPIGLTMVSFTGVDLLTSNMMSVTAERTNPSSFYVLVFQCLAE